MDIYGNDESICVKRLQITAKYLGIKINLHDIDLTVDPLFLGQPLLKRKEGDIIGCHGVTKFMCMSVEEDLLQGKNPQIKTWLDFGSKIRQTLYYWVAVAQEINPYVRPVVQQKKTEIAQLLNRLNQYLADKTFLLGEKISLADIIISCALTDGIVHVLFPQFLKKYTNVLRWYNTVIRQEIFAQVLGKIEFCQKEYLPKKSKKNKK
ncbi:elongation factor 1-gamma [Anaeramoeba flamelloides]|uniref:Elongation factor 1-gamma n=1 Tax=Anaeramoeba flamelloides TaxID=1746091 RepID=A0ABQ8XBR9_9EUKA|nr:elongation factor 1-gamma [Anaeramoeba flamelloides]